MFPDSAVPGPRVDWLNECLKWFDCHLKGIDNGVMQEPPLILFVREYSKPETILLEDRGVFRSENEWPPARAHMTPMYFHAEGRLERNAPTVSDGTAGDTVDLDPRVGTTTGMHGGGPFSVNLLMPLDQRPDEIYSLTYTTAPLDEDMDIIGQPRVVLHFASTADTTPLLR